MPVTEPIKIPIEGEEADFIASAKKVQAQMDEMSKKLKEAGVSQTAYNKAVAQSRQEAEKVKSALAAQAKATQATTTETKKSALSWTDFRSAYMVALDAVRVGQQVWAATGQEFVNYAEQVKNLSRNIGVTAEDASRLIQVADDVRISYASLGTAMKIAQKQGIDVSIDGLEKLADKYKSLAPGIERSQFLQKTFGKSGLEMGKLLERGGDGVRKMSDAIDDNLVLTEEAIKKSDAYQKKLDDLDDSVMALKISIGEKLVPAMADAATIANANVTAFTSFGDVLDGKVKLNDWAANIINANNVWEETGAITEDNTVAIDDNSGALEDNKAAVKAAENALKDYKDMLEQVSQANQDAESFLQSYADFQKDYVKDHADAVAAIRDAEDELYWVRENNAGKNPLDWQDELGDANNNLFEAKKAVQDLEATWHESTQKMIYDMILAKVSVDGLTNAEFKATQDLAVQMGIRTQAQADEAKAMMDKAQTAADGIALQEDVMAEKAQTDADLLALEQERAIAAGETTNTVVSGATAQAQAIARVTTTTMIETSAQYQLAAAARATAAAYAGIGGRSGMVLPTGISTTQNDMRRGRGTSTRDSGGAGIAGTPYMIGIGAQPEMFIPSTNGTFVPNANKLGNTYNITVNNPKKETAENSIRSALKNMSYLGAAA